MRNRGLLPGLKGQRYAYTPRIMDSLGAPVNLGTAPFFSGLNRLGDARTRGDYVVTKDGLCIGQLEASFGTGGAAGTGIYYFGLPFPGRTANEMLSNMVIGAAHVTRAGLLGPIPGTAMMYSAALAAAQSVPTLGPGAWMTINTPVQVNGGVADVPIGAASLVVAHGLGVTPTGVSLVPNETWATATQGGNVPTAGFWASAIDATNLTVNVGTTNLTAIVSMLWTAFKSAGAVGAANPFVMGNGGDMIRANFCYPIA